jgi:5'-nucleotidase
MPCRRAAVLIAAVVAVWTAACGHQLPAAGTLDLQLLAINDFHGTIEPPSGSNGRIRDTPAGGLEYLATHLRSLAATSPNTLIVSAGDNIGASPLISGMFHDEPSIEGLSETGLQLSAVGNHELDEGWAELYRMQKGGCHPVDGCQDQTPFAGATFQYLSANILVDPMRVDAQALQRSGWQRDHPGAERQPLFPAYAIREVNGVKVGFIGLTLRGVTSLVSPPGITGLTILPEADAANSAARELESRGVHAIVVLIHEGGVPAGEPGQENPDTCDDFTGPIVAIANAMTDDIGVIVSGHTHRAYVCTIGTKLVTSAASLGRLITDIDLHIDRVTGRIVSKKAANVTVTRDVMPDAAEHTLIAHYAPLAAVVASRVVGSATDTIPQARNAAGESALGDLVTDAMLEAARANGAHVDAALMNSGGIRNDLVPTGGAAAGEAPAVTYGDVFNVLPFGNVVIVKTLTGDAIARILDQQFQRTTRFLQVSRGFTYAWDSTKPAGSRVDRDSIRIDGKPLVMTQEYRIAMVDFLWNGGDDFSIAATESSEPSAVGTDVDVFVSYLSKHSPLAPGPQNRVRRER